MEFEDSQFQAAPVGSANGFDSFAAPVADYAAPYGSTSAVNGLEDFFSGSDRVPAAEGLAADFISAVPASAPPPFPIDDAAATATSAGGIADEDPFFEHYTPPAPTAPSPAPEVVDPRVEWRKQNNELLKKKDAEETACKEKLKGTAAQYLSKYYEVRTTTLTQRKANNRKSEAHQKEVEVPLSGTPWEKINALVNLNSGNHQKDVARYKALLITCKAKNVAIRA
ncbi:hypothetical protein VOLCADRAFT_108157 [Volvox carteri f. nagariensis]|uniref:Clathrin light chain n=1 Tax=Volvox carteri f. nagariensis TaxID=3068 RepID=D8UIM0_VOLCA|nr:uncharacterized protein VOLCADRAFT_108157 [Volvox carteri f. nagariensis]EFJ40419.1 hypothetical protein VOLCADRAFT_108157 [Volvox carteri f. nagariensis]|eukprot:XP_002958499.1 hypothetical protein VOLCADRAFT_108157 [Volvox carteri f. nagariensis]